jgi:carbon starvation protein
VKLAEGTELRMREEPQRFEVDGKTSGLLVPEGTKIVYPRAGREPVEVKRSESFRVVFPSSAKVQVQKVPGADGPHPDPLPKGEGDEVRAVLTLPKDARQQVPGSSWGTFTIACTIPIALFVGWYMYRLRKGHVVEASAIGALGVLAATVGGNWIPGSVLEPLFQLTRGQTIFAPTASSRRSFPCGCCCARAITCRAS